MTKSIDALALASWLERNLDGFRRPLEWRRFGGGQSNPTYQLETPSNFYVLRAKPSGALLPSAHAIDREFRVMRALEQTQVPVPRMLAYCDDAAIIGAPFYVMSHVEGRIFWDPALPGLSPQERRAMYDDVNRCIVALHSIDPTTVGLADFGRPGHYLERQIARWTRQYLAAEKQPIEAMRRLIEWLPSHLPSPGGTAIVHGDLRLDNMIFHPVEPRVIALIDWELSTLGDPLSDFAYHVLTWILRPDEFRGMAEADFDALGIPTLETYMDCYAERRGLGAINPALMDFHLVFSLFRLAAILQGIFKRAEEGTASAANAHDTGAKATAIANLAWSRARDRIGAFGS